MAFETRSQDLRCLDNFGNPSSDPDCAWKFTARLAPADPVDDITHTMDPAICAGPSSTALTFTVDTSNRYRALQWQWLMAEEWAWYGNKTFASRPACAMREDVSGKPGFVVAGKASQDSKIYASAGVMALGGSPQENPVTAGQFEKVSDTVYSTGSGPAIASGGVASNSVVLVLMANDQRTIHAYVRPMPYGPSKWTSVISGPRLPLGWNAVGAPSIARLPVTFQIVVHARNGTQDRLFTTHFYGEGQHFSNGLGSPSSTWTMLADMGTIDGEPALTFHDEHGSTVYFRRGDQLLQTTGSPLGQNPVLAVHPSQGIAYESSPAAVANWAFESQNGRHTVIARTTSDQLYISTTTIDGSVVP